MEVAKLLLATVCCVATHATTRTFASIDVVIAIVIMNERASKPSGVVVVASRGGERRVRSSGQARVRGWHLFLEWRWAFPKIGRKSIWDRCSAVPCAVKTHPSCSRERQGGETLNITREGVFFSDFCGGFI